MSFAFDPLKYTQGAVKIGVPREQAEYQAEQLNNMIHFDLATKQDLKELELRMTIRLGSIVVATGAILGLVQYFIS